MNNSQTCKYALLLRGINVSGHHKVPMVELRNVLQNMGFANILTILNSGNVIFDSENSGIETLETSIEITLEKHFGFPIPAIVREAEDILRIWNLNPFKNINVTKDTRLYVTFLKKEPIVNITFPWLSDDKSFQILDVKFNTVLSVLDLFISSTPKGMDALERLFSKEITTRNWNTLIKILDELKVLKALP